MFASEELIPLDQEHERDHWTWSSDGKDWSPPTLSRHLTIKGAREETKGAFLLGRTFDPAVMRQELVASALNDETMQLFEERMEDFLIHQGAPRACVSGTPFREPVGAKEWEELLGDLFSTMNRWAERHQIAPNWIFVIDVEKIPTDDPVAKGE